MLLPHATEEERKILASMLGKLHVSPTSTPQKLQAAHELLTDAIEARIASDAPSRNASNKLLAALTKAIGSSGAANATTTAAAAATAAKKGADEGRGNVTACEDGVTAMNAEEEEVVEKMEGVEGVEGVERKDSVLAEAEAAEEL